jgi:hypothetical protein
MVHWPKAAVIQKEKPRNLPPDSSVTIGIKYLSNNDLSYPLSSSFLRSPLYVRPDYFRNLSSSRRTSRAVQREEGRWKGSEMIASIERLLHVCTTEEGILVNRI